MFSDKLFYPANFPNLRDIAHPVHVVNRNGELLPGECLRTEGGLLFVNGYPSKVIATAIADGRVVWFPIAKDSK